MAKEKNGGFIYRSRMEWVGSIAKDYLRSFCMGVFLAGSLSCWESFLSERD